MSHSLNLRKSQSPLPFMSDVSSDLASVTQDKSPGREWLTELSSGHGPAPVGREPSSWLGSRWVPGMALPLRPLQCERASQYALKEGVIATLCKTVIEYLSYAKKCAK